jgi:uncharacterized protein (TIGR02266 family)
MSALAPNSCAIDAARLDLDTAERELAEQEQTIEARLQVAQRTSVALEARIHKLLDDAHSEQLGPVSETVRNQLTALMPRPPDRSALEQARAARCDAAAARSRAHQKMDAALVQGGRVLAEIGRALAEIEHRIEEARRNPTPPPLPAAAVATASTATPATRLSELTAPTLGVEPALASPAPPLTAQPDDRRRNPRVRFERAVDLSSDENFYTGFANDISTGGLFVATIDPPPRGSRVELAFSLPDGTRIETEGEVRWTREFNDRIADMAPGVGIQFCQLDPEARRAIERFVAERGALFFPD